MGFLLDGGVDRRAAAEALVPFAYNELGCLHVELGDRRLTAEGMTGSGYDAATGITFVVNLEPPEAVIFGNIQSSTRNYIRQAGRMGLKAEVATGVGFANEYYAQLVEVFARQGLTPTYGPKRVRQLITALEPTGQLLLLRVRSPDGTSMATAIAVGRNRTAILWGTASIQSKTGLHPNELLHWEVMRHWRMRGLSRYDMGGGGAYKAKYGGTQLATVRFHRSRYPVLRHGRAMVRYLVRSRQVIAGLAYGIGLRLGRGPR
jgi:hypothetical protein